MSLNRNMVQRAGSLLLFAAVGIFLMAGAAVGQSRFPPGSGTTAKNQASSPTIGGILRRMSDDDVIVETEDKQILTIALGITTKYYKASGAMIRSVEMQPGDHVNIEATQDDRGFYHAKSVTQMKAGTAAERAAASQPVDTRPTGRDLDSRLATPPIPPAPPSPPSPASPPSPPSPPDPNDPGPPRVRRGIPPPNSNPPLVGRNDSPAPGRPSIHADEVNGVTRAPGAPVVDPNAPQGGRNFRSGGDPIIDDAREAAFSFAETLPNYVVKQFTTRFETEAARGGQTSWRAIDTVTADVVSENGQETYKNILVNGKPPREDVDKSGTWSTGEYSSVLLDVLSPGTQTDFHNKRSTTIVNRAAWRYDFSVDQPNSHWSIHASTRSYNPEYVGAIWIDKESSRVLRIELAARNMPRAFPLDTVESSVDYDYVPIGDARYLLPVHSEALSCERGTSVCGRNSIDFRNYKKFTADSSITFDTPPDK
jgi:hypothetical protein